MKKFAILIAVVFAIMATGTAVFAANEKVGFLDEAYVLSQYDKFRQAQEQFEQIGRKKSETAKAAFDKETDDTKKAQIVQNMQLEMREEEAKLLSPVFQELNRIVEKVAKAKGVTIVVNKGLIYYGGVDLTNDVITELKRK
ncbi:OmpH family outer membrane protein [Synergistaceae bacterium OttesenSCG-928-D05]|nr:OmpH family outer membrane protein [Synergistaceae bacterium OttesenSCG-928-D05]